MIGDADNELVYKSLLNGRALPDGFAAYTTADPDEFNLLRVELPFNRRYNLLAHSDASMLLLPSGI
jgi:hypothetical protein